MGATKHVPRRACNVDFRKSQQLLHGCSQMAEKQSKRLQTGRFRPRPCAKIPQAPEIYSVCEARSAMWEAIASELVAAGDGALRTNSAPSASLKTKSSTSAP